MKYNKLIVLGIDCLDFNLVHRWQLKEYMLDKVGYHFVGYELYTPIIWAKFLTGIDVTKYGYNITNLSRRKRLKSLFYLATPILEIAKKINLKKSILYHNKTRVTCKNSILPNPSSIFTKYIKLQNPDALSFLEKIVLKLLINAARTERIPMKLYKKTFVYEAKMQGLKVAMIEFPPINDKIYSLVRNMLFFYIDKPIKERQLFLEYTWKLTIKSLQLISKIIEDFDIILWYTPYIDIASHMFYKPSCPACLLRLRIAYKRLAEKINTIVTRIENYNTAIFLVSDHGFNPKKQDHSHFGYWTTNVSLKSQPKTVLDFAWIIRNIIKQMINK